MFFEDPSRVDFESIKTNLEEIEFLPDEPIELFFYRISNVLRQSLPSDLRRLTSISYNELSPGRLLFSRPEISDVLDDLIYRKREFDKTHPISKVVFFKDVDVIELIGSSFTHTDERKIDLSTDDSMKAAFDNLLNNRSFFNNLYARDGIIDNLFLIGNPTTEQQKEYLSSLLKDKNVLLVGGGRSCEDLADEEFGIKSLINIDPFLSPDGESRLSDLQIYRHFDYFSQDNNLVKKLDGKFDEIWAHYSVPMYSKTPEDMRASFDNMVSLLSVGGTIRIYPLLVGYDYSLEESGRRMSNSMFDALAEIVKGLDLREDVNIFYVPEELHASGGTLIIKRLK